MAHARRSGYRREALSGREERERAKPAQEKLGDAGLLDHFAED